jgi:Flp pilus assembly pilin Flp
MRRALRRSGQSGQATTEFVLLVALVAVPMWVLIRALMQVVLKDFIVTLISRFTQG